MALLRKIFFRKPPDGLFEISDRVYVFEYCFTTDVVQTENYKAYISGIVSQLRAYFPEGSFTVFNFREGEGQSQIANILSEHEMTVIDYPRQYEGCPLLTMEVVHHFLRSSESWLLVGQHNVLLMHCERGGWPVLAFMLAGLLVYRKQYAAEQKILDMIHKQAPHELLQLFSPLNPLPSQLRYLKYISRRNLGSEWPPKGRDLTMDCIILSSVPNMDGNGGCRPILRIYGQDPLLASDPSPKVLFSIPKRSKRVRHHKQVDSGLVKIDINCHIKGDVVLECISLDNDLKLESMMFRVMFNTAFIRSNILMLNLDEIDILWDAKDLFPKEFRAEVIFSEMDAPTSAAAINLPAIIDKEELPLDAFAKVHEIFSNVDWMDPRPDLTLNVLDQITISPPLKEKLHSVPDQKTEICRPEDLTQEKVDPLQTTALSVVKGMMKISSGQKAESTEVSTVQIPEFMRSFDTFGNNEISVAMVLQKQKASLEALIKEKAELRIRNASAVLQDKKEMLSAKREKPDVLDAAGSEKLDRKKTLVESESKSKHSTSKGLEKQESSMASSVDANLIVEEIELPQRIASNVLGGKLGISYYQKAESHSFTELVPLKPDDKPKSQTLDTITSPTSTPLQKQSKPSSGTSVDTISIKMKTQPEGLLPVLHQPTISKIISPRFSHSPRSSPIQKSNSLPTSPLSVSRYGASPSLGITAILDGHAPYSGDGSSQSRVESPPCSSTSVASVPYLTRPVRSSAQSPLSPPPAPPMPPSPLSSWHHPDASVKLSPPLEPLPFSCVSGSELGNSSGDHYDITPVQPKIVPCPLSSGKISPKPYVSPPPAPPPPPSTKLSLPPPLPPPPPPPSSCRSMSKLSNLSEDHNAGTPVQATIVSSQLCSGVMPSNPSASAPLPPHVPPPLVSVPPPYKLSSFSKPSPPPPPPLPKNTKSGGKADLSLSSAKLGTPTSTPLPPPLPPKTSTLVSSTSSLVPPPPPPPRVSITSPKTGISPPCPPVPAPPSARGFSNGSPQPPPVPGNNGPIPPAPGPPSSAKGRALTRSLAKNPNQSKRTTLKPYHWLKLTRVMQGSLWAEAQKTGEASKAPEFDMSELEKLFSAATPNSEHRRLGGRSNGGASGPKSDKIHLIELRRAYNCEIMLSKVKVPLPDLMNSVLALDDTGLDVDQVENLIKFCPTKEEMELLKGYKGDKENLGKCEQFFLELIKVPRVESKLRVFCFKMQFTSQVSDLRKNLNIINSASEEVRSSEKLRRIMHTILQLGNALNQGTTRGSAVGFRLDSLLKLTDTRARNNKMTLMHYLCKVLDEKLPELLDFPNDLTSLEAATKIQLKILAEEMQAISKGLEKVAQELTTSENDGPVSESFRKLLKVFLSHAEGEVRSLASLYSIVGRNADALAMYFGEDPAKCPFEQVVSTLLNFSRMFTRAHEENCKQLEFEKKKAEKEAEKEKLMMDSPVESATKMGDV